MKTNLLQMHLYAQTILLYTIGKKITKISKNMGKKPQI